MHDKVNNFVCPIADFFSSGHDSKTIASFLLLIKDELEKFIPKRSFQQAPIIVTDFSWALINAVLITFNKCSFETYILWCADLLISKKIWNIHLMSTIHILCYSHFIKMISKKIRKIKKFSSPKNNTKIHQVALYSCAILQKSNSMEEFSENIKHCFNIFNTKYESNVKSKSLKAIREKVVNGSISKDIDWRNFSENVPDTKTSRNVIFFQNANERNYREKSLFLNYFTKIINKN